MSCGCNSNPCNCLPRPSLCCTPTVESVEYTFENGNILGIGVFDNDTDNLVQFRGVYSDSAALTVSLDAGNNAIKLSFDQDALVADIPDADTTTRGILETATNAEAQAKAATNKILVPSNLAALAASDSFAGLVELATDAETIAGISSTLAVTPAGLAAVGATNTLVTWADSVTRAGATPTYDGQIGVQLDTNIPWVASGTTAGDFDVPVLISGLNTLTSITTIATAGFQFLFSGAGSVSIETEFGVTGVATFIGPTTTFGTGAGEFVNFEGSGLQINGGTFTNALLGTDGSGIATSHSLALFISTYNTQTGYTTFGNPATLRTCDTATVTLQQLAQLVGTLIEDLKAVLLPTT